MLFVGPSIRRHFGSSEFRFDLICLRGAMMIVFTLLLPAVLQAQNCHRVGWRRPQEKLVAVVSEAEHAPRVPGTREISSGIVSCLSGVVLALQFGTARAEESERRTLEIAVCPMTFLLVLLVLAIVALVFMAGMLTARMKGEIVKKEKEEKPLDKEQFAGDLVMSDGLWFLVHRFTLVHLREACAVRSLTRSGVKKEVVRRLVLSLVDDGPTQKQVTLIVDLITKQGSRCELEIGDLISVRAASRWISEAIVAAKVSRRR